MYICIYVYMYLCVCICAICMYVSVMCLCIYIYVHKYNMKKNAGKLYNIAGGVAPCPVLCAPPIIQN
jgi:hypothetical protein